MLQIGPTSISTSRDSIGFIRPAAIQLLHLADEGRNDLSELLW